MTIRERKEEELQLIEMPRKDNQLVGWTPPQKKQWSGDKNTEMDWGNDDILIRRQGI